MVKVGQPFAADTLTEEKKERRILSHIEKNLFKVGQLFATDTLKEEKIEKWHNFFERVDEE